MAMPQVGPKSPFRLVGAALAAAVMFAAPARAAEERLAPLDARDPIALIEDAYAAMNAAPADALALSEKIQGLAGTPKDAKFQGRLGYVRARALTHLGRFPEAIAEAQKALGAINGADPALRASILTTMAISLGRSQETLRAFDALQEALTINRRLDDSRGEAASYAALAELYADIGLDAKSIETYGEALARARLSGDKRIIAVTLNNFAYTLNLFGDPAQALAYLEEAEALSNETNLSRLTAFIHVNKSRSFYYLGRFAESEESARRGRELSERYAHRDLVSFADLLLALNAKRNGTLKEAAQFAARAKTNADTARSNDRYRETLRLIAEIAEAQGDYKAANQYRAEEARQMEQVFRSVSSRSAALFEAETKLAAQQVELAMLKRDSEIAKLAAARATLLRNFALLAAILLGAMLVFLALLLIEKAKRKRQLLRTNDELTAAYRDLEAANKVKSNFLAVISHELKTPLNSIIGFSDILANGKSTSGSNEFLMDYAKIINAQGRNLLRLVSDILLFTRTEPNAVALKEGSDALGAIVTEAIALTQEARPEASERIDIGLEEPELEIRCDPVQIANCLARILDNALKFSPAASRVALRASVNANGEVEVEIADTGVGVGPGDIPKFLDVLSQGDQSLSRRQSGAGLGLPIANLIMAAHGGRIEISRRPGGGTVVSSILPASRVGPAEDLAAA